VHNKLSLGANATKDLSSDYFRSEYRNSSEEMLRDRSSALCMSRDCSHCRPPPPRTELLDGNCHISLHLSRLSCLSCAFITLVNMKIEAWRTWVLNGYCLGSRGNPEFCPPNVKVGRGFLVAVVKLNVPSVRERVPHSLKSTHCDWFKFPCQMNVRKFKLSACGDHACDQLCLLLDARLMPALHHKIDSKQPS
jgi:hypothetical protein